MYSYALTKRGEEMIAIVEANSKALKLSPGFLNGIALCKESKRISLDLIKECLKHANAVQTEKKFLLFDALSGSQVVFPQKERSVEKNTAAKRKVHPEELEYRHLVRNVEPTLSNRNTHRINIKEFVNVGSSAFGTLFSMATGFLVGFYGLTLFTEPTLAQQLVWGGVSMIMLLAVDLTRIGLNAHIQSQKKNSVTQTHLNEDNETLFNPLYAQEGYTKDAIVEEEFVIGGRGVSKSRVHTDATSGSLPVRMRSGAERHKAE